MAKKQRIRIPCNNGFHPFVVLFKFFGLDKLDVSRKLKFRTAIAQVYRALPVAALLCSIYFDGLALIQTLNTFFYNEELSFLVGVYNIDSAVYTLVCCMLYLNYQNRRNGVYEVLKFFESFDEITKLHCIPTCQETLRNQAVKLIVITNLYFVGMTILSVADMSTSLLSALMIIYYHFGYYVYLLELNFYVFLFWNVFIRLKTLQALRPNEFNINAHSPEISRDVLFLIHEIQCSLLPKISQRFGWNLCWILCRNVSNCMNNLCDRAFISVYFLCGASTGFFEIFGMPLNEADSSFANYQFGYISKKFI